MLILEKQFKERWIGFVANKWFFYQQIPHVMTGAFAEYIGYSKEVCKAAVRKLSE